MFDLMTRPAEPIAPGISRQWDAEGRLVIYILHTTELDSWNRWGEVVIQTMRDWPHDRPYLVLYDVSDPTMNLTPYIRRWSQRFSTECPGVQGRVALVVSRGPMGQILCLMVNHLVKTGGYRPMKAFVDMEEALSWLGEVLEG